LTAAPLSAPYALSYAYKRSLDAVHSAFFTALRNRKFLAARTATGEIMCPPQAFDPATGDAIVELVPVGPAGTVMGWAWVGEPRPQHPLQHPFAFAMIALDGATQATLHVVDCGDPSVLRRGLKVMPRWSETPTGGILDVLAFVPGTSAETAETAQTSDTPQNRAESGEGAAEFGPVTRFKAPVHLDYTIRAGTEQTRFLQALMHRKILGSVDAASGEVYVPTRPTSPVTGAPCTEVVEVGQSGVVTTFCIVRIPFEGQRIAPPYVCAQVQLDGADTPLFHLVGGCRVDDVQIGMRVTAEWVADEELAPTLESIKWFVPEQAIEAIPERADA
jgi:uncharacterized protein